MARNEIVAPRGSRLIIMASICVVVAALWFMQDVLIPVALSILLTFLFTPLVHRLEKWGLGRIGSVLVVMSTTIALILVLGWVVGQQVLSLANNLESYKHNITYKIRSFRGSGTDVGTKVANAVEGIKEEISKPTTDATQESTTQKVLETVAGTPPPVLTGDGKPNPHEGVAQFTEKNPLPVRQIPDQPTPAQQLASYVGRFVGPLGTLGLVIVFVIFMLLSREDLRDRLIRLVGHGQLQVTTTALDDAATRISRYLMAQAIVNGTYGLAIAIGLWLIGFFMGDEKANDPSNFPSLVLWGLLCAILRFIPYIGPWIAAIFPLAVSFAAYHGFGPFVAVALMFVVIELLSNNIMEPWLYGSSTGMSTIAVLVSAVFWTFLWGPVGLLLATPLTVCLVVLGKYVPQLAFLDVMLGDEPVLSPPERVYQRLLAMDQEEVTDLAQEYLRDKSLEQVYDEMLMPALAMAEQDRHRGRLDERRQAFIRTALRDVIEELGDVQRQRDEQQERVEAKTLAGEAADAVVNAAKGVVEAIVSNGNGGGAGGSSGNGKQAAASKVTLKPGGSVDLKPNEPKPRTRLPKECVVNVLVLPAHDEADEIVGRMLAQLLEFQGYCAHAASVTALAGEMVEMVEQRESDLVAVSAMPPAAVAHSRYLCKRIHQKYPDIRMIVGLWAFRGDLKKATDRITCVGSVGVVTTLGDAMDQIHQQVQPLLIRSDSTRQPVSPMSSPAAKA
jgi:predicted PurR-regulated permease PerM